ncbi:MAG TPA: holo-ACP synthase [Acidimicrobiales bacterium]|nr:holo-ACP synthase [Acidimicrobiales bacterium]
MTLSVGIDVCDVVRFAAVMARRPRIVERLFTERERRDTKMKPERLAARFAAKEATLKTLKVGVGGAAWHDIEVRKQPSGAPMLHLTGRAAELAKELGLATFEISLTHTDISAAAIVVATSEARDEC